MTATTFRTIALIPLLLGAASCGGGNAMTPPTPACVPTQPTEFAYVLSGDSIAMYSVDSCTGALTATTPATVATGSTSGEPQPEGLAGDPLGRFAYVANIISNATDNATISMYTVDPSTGVLAPTTPATVPTGFYPQGIAISPNGQFVYTANSDGNSVSMFAIDPNTGNLTPTTPASVAAGWSPDGVTVHPSGKFAYAVNQDDGTVSMYTVNQTTGVLTPTTPATVLAGASPFEITIDPSGRFAYVPDTYSAPNNFISQYTIDSTTGVLTPNATSVVSAGNQPTAVAVDPSGKFAYVTNRQDSAVSMFTIDSTGSLTPNGIVAAGGEPFQVTVDPSGKFVYVANEEGPLSIYTLQSDGTLQAVNSNVPGPAWAVAVIKAKQ